MVNEKPKTACVTKRPSIGRAVGFAAVVMISQIFMQPLCAAETSTTALAENTHFHGIAVDLDNSSRLYLATHHGIYAVGPDGGADLISSDRNDYMGFTPHPTDPDMLFGSGHPAGGGNMGFIASSNGGKSWKKLSDGVDGPVDFHQMDVSKADPKTMVGLSRGIQISKDGGRSWKKVGPAPKGAIDLAASATDVDTFYVATRLGIQRSTDGGRSWSAAQMFRRPSTMIHVTADGIVYAYQVGTGLIRTVEPDLKWQLLNNDFGDAYVLHLAVDPNDDKKLYAVTVNARTRAQVIMVSDDGGTSWKALGAK